MLFFLLVLNDREKAGRSEAREAGRCSFFVANGEAIRPSLWWIIAKPLGHHPSETAHRDLNLAWVRIVLRKEKGGFVVLDI